MVWKLMTGEELGEGRGEVRGDVRGEGGGRGTWLPYRIPEDIGEPWGEGECDRRLLLPVELERRGKETKLISS